MNYIRNKPYVKKLLIDLKKRPLTTLWQMSTFCGLFVGLGIGATNGLYKGVTLPLPYYTDHPIPSRIEYRTTSILYKTTSGTLSGAFWGCAGGVLIPVGTVIGIAWIPIYCMCRIEDFFRNR